MDNRNKRGEASRLGTPKSGIAARINGWDAGVEVYAQSTDDGADVFRVHVSGGSNETLCPAVSMIVRRVNGVTTVSVTDPNGFARQIA
jgi:hypothetical protein